MSNSPAGPGADSDYRTTVNRALLATCGVSYEQMVQIAPAMDPGSAMLNRASARQMEPSEFAAAFQNIHNLAGLDNVGSLERAEAINERRAATISFGSELRLWKLSSEGAAYLGIEGGRALRLDVGATGSTWIISESVGECHLGDHPNDRLGRLTGMQDVGFQEVCEDIDIIDALRAELRLRPQRKAAWDDMVPAVAADQEVTSAMRMG